MNRRFGLAIVSSFFIFFLFFLNGSAFAKDSAELVSIAKKYIGVPYKWGGTTARGFDCSGFINFVFDQIEVDLPRTTSSLYQTGTPVAKSNLQNGDLVFFNTSGSGVSHAGIYIGNNQFIHSSSSKGVTITNLNDPYYWGPRYIGAKRVVTFVKPLPIGEYHDVSKNYWAYEAITTLSKQQIIKGYENDYFNPEQYVTRAQVAVMLARALKLNTTDRSQIFNDVNSSHWAVGAINALYKEGIIKGDPNNNFNPNDYLLREHVALMFTKAFDLPASPQSGTFNDVSPTSYTRDSIDRLAFSGIANGYPDGSFKPHHAVKRSQFSAFLYRALNLQ
ncbi:C40 family peptidase [Bacillus litorisediminis]|uniref:C40 family peptidase n=1 Tax=Bacillus litorisediminis TaxID=2922713 RepID=UPI001FAFAD5C|nr:C40 family peptidase [Bacillus litorisediminis]